MDDLKLVKKYYGEKMSHLCRDLFPSVLETEGLLFKTLSDNFHYSKFLYDDLIENNLIGEFKEYIYSLLDPKERKKITVDKNPYELIEEAGYTLYKCETESDIQKFEKYYAPGEELCTFNGGRLNTCHVFFAVKKNVDEIKRENFKNPNRQDEYGTSVISIQFSKGKNNYLSIKNRYNHTVKNPDATFSNNLDNIAIGLTESFKKEFGYKLEKSKNDDFEIPGYVKASNRKFYKYNIELNNVYYCADNIMIKNGKLKKKYLDKNRYLVFDYFILDLLNKKFIVNYPDSLSSTINILNMDKMNIIKNKEGNKEIIFIKDDKKIIITIDKENRIVSYYDGINEIILDSFLKYGCYLKKVELLKAKKIHYDSFKDCKEIEEFYAPLLEETENSFLEINSIKNLTFPSLKQAGLYFMNYSPKLKEINLPTLKVLEGKGISSAENLERISMPKVKVIGHSCLQKNRLIEMDLPELERLGGCFLEYNKTLEVLSIPKLSYIPYGMLFDNNTLEHIYVPCAKKMEANAFHNNRVLESFIAPNLIEIKEDTMFTLHNELPNLNHLHLADEVFVGDYFLNTRILNPILLIHKAVADFFNKTDKYENKIKVGNIEGKEEIEKLKEKLSRAPKKVKKIVLYHHNYNNKSL